MDHDRSKGENVGPFDYTLIKLEVLAPLPPSIAAIEGIADRKVYFVAATMRPETMYGQTNCWVSPTIEYVAIAINETEIFVCTRRAALNIAYQPYQPDSGLGVQGNTRPEGTCDIVAQVPGGELIGCRLSAPLAEYPVVYALPLLTISAAKGTGIVTSVPSDSPDDYAGLRDLKNKKALRAKYVPFLAYYKYLIRARQNDVHLMFAACCLGMVSPTRWCCRSIPSQSSTSLDSPACPPKRLVTTSRWPRRTTPPSWPRRKTCAIKKGFLRESCSREHSLAKRYVLRRPPADREAPLIATFSR